MVQLLREVTVPMAELWFAASGLLMIVFGVPLILRRVPPNAFYGLRVPATFKDEQVWYDANAASGRDLVVFGIALIVSAGAMSALGWTAESHRLAWAMVAALGAILLTLLGWSRANRLLRERQEKRGA